MLLPKHFNPRSRVGNDHEDRVPSADDQISIHVPAWGPTKFPALGISLGEFQSTFPRGERHKEPNPLIRQGLFQSTFPRGERQQILTIFRLYFCIGITNLHFTSLLLSEFFILFISFVRFFNFFMVRVSLGFSVCF